MQKIKPGIYRHFKGNEYKVIALGRLSGSTEEVVVYQGLYDSPEFGPNPVWVRPVSEFIDEVERDGKIMKRFEWLREA